MPSWPRPARPAIPWPSHCERRSRHDSPAPELPDGLRLVVFDFIFREMKDRPQTDAAFCREMLLKVSRTFALCVRFLPPKVSYAVLVAYLLCRIADTIEDTVSL